MDLFSPALKNIISSAMADVFDTFARDFRVRFYKEVAVVFVPDSDYNSDFQRRSNNKNIKTEVSEEFKARVWYVDRQEEEKFMTGDDMNIRWDNNVNRIRVQLPIAALAYLEAAVRFEFNGMKWQKESSVAQLGVYSVLEYCEVHLRRIL